MGNHCYYYKWPFPFELNPRQYWVACLFALQSEAFIQQTWLFLNPLWGVGEELSKQALHNAAVIIRLFSHPIILHFTICNLTFELHCHLIMSLVRPQRCTLSLLMLTHKKKEKGWHLLITRLMRCEAVSASSTPLVMFLWLLTAILFAVNDSLL